MSGRRRGMIDATPKVRSMKPCCLRSRVGSSYERALLGRSSGQPGEALSSCEVQPQAQFINDDHHADGGMDERGRGVARHSRSVLTGPIESGLLD
jgi:hypothetical protein